MSLSATRLGGDNTPRTLIMLHGIYGRGRNWQTIAKAVVAARSDFACWLVDLPHHGDSGAGDHGDTLRGLAADLQDWLRGQDLTPTAVLGHSFGGKVALAYADVAAVSPLQVWVIDSTPESKTAGGGAWALLERVKGLPASFESREEAADAIMAGGFSKGVAVWMASNLAREGDRFGWTIDFAAMERLMDDFFATDLWPLVESHRPGLDLHFLKASTSSAMSDEAAARIEGSAHPGLTLHRRDGSHWIHAEEPQVVVDLLLEHLP
jgi:esterase